MRRLTVGPLTVLLLIGLASQSLFAQQELCKPLDAESGRRFLPDRVPMESESIPVDNKTFAGVEFPNKSRIAIAALIGTGLSPEMQQKYQYVFISEARVKLDRWSIPAGMIGLGPASAGGQGGPILSLIARDFIGTEIDTIILKLDPNAKDAKVSMTPTGPNSFDLHIGKYLIKGAQR